MPTATSNFLQGTNAANAAAVSTSTVGHAASLPVDEAQILAAVAEPAVRDLNSLATQLGVAPALISPEVERLSKQGLVEYVGELKLSEAGERFLRYADLAGL
jgi:DNA-binding MarR family transcriptional regulator